ncbi:discoidin domain-containing protein [Streptomyces aculeolatus]
MATPTPLPRRRFLLAGGATAAGLVLASPGAGAAAPAALSPEALLYHRLLLRHTRWVETQWDADAGRYPLADFRFVSVLGNAVLLTHGTYDADLAGVDRDTLADHTVRTIRHFAATNFWATGASWGGGGYEWGGRVFWDGTFESYFTAAARLLWDELDDATRGHVDAIAVRGAQYVAGLGAGEDPRSGGWSSNGLAGGHRGDSKIEEMGAKSMPLATGLAYHPDHPDAGAWREWLTRWLSNMTGLPSADRENGTLIDGRPVSEWNTAQNMYEDHVVENHGTYAPMYQQSTGAYPGRNALHFLIAGAPLPEVLAKQPNADGLWHTMTHLGTAAGLSAHPMVNDRYHLYGRDVLPLTWRRMGQADPYTARSEVLLAAHLEPYLAYPPENRLTKFSGEPKYEPEARAEVATAYLLHAWRDRLHGDVRPVSEARYWASVAGATDYGAEVGLVAHQSARALAMAVSKAGHVKFAFLPEHDDWLFDVTGAAPAFLPGTALAVTGRRVARYTRAGDGFDGSATVLRFEAGAAGFATLPTGAVVYTTSGLGADEGRLRLHTLAMPGVRGLDGDRTFHGPGGSVTLAPDGGDGGVDEVRFPAVAARHIRILGVRPATQYGYSLWHVEAYATGTDPGSDPGTDLARGRPVTASSADPAYPPPHATDGDPATRWAVSRAERPRADSWLAVDLGAEHRVDRVRLGWEAAYGAEYRVQVSADGTEWRDAAAVPAAHAFAGNWLNVDDRAGFVVRGGGAPIRVTATSVTLAPGPAAPLTAVAYPAQRAPRTRALAAVPPPTTDTPGVTAALADGYLAVFNLTDAAVRARVRTPDRTVTVDLPAAGAAVLPPGS